MELGVEDPAVADGVELAESVELGVDEMVPDGVAEDVALGVPDDVELGVADAD